MSTNEEPIETTIEEHSGPIKTPKQLLITVILAFLVPITIIMMLAHLVASETETGAGSNSLTANSIESRIKPVASLKLVDANAPKVFQTGQQVFESTCTACHTAGVAGAPKIGDKDAWAPFIKTGYDEMIKNAIHGVGAMPPKGGNTSLSDYEVERAVVYIANKSGASFDEPKAPAETEKSPTQPADTGAQAKAEAATAPATTAKADQAGTTQAAGESKKADQATKDKAKADDTAKASDGKAKPAATAAAATAQIDPAGEKLYKAVCFACHAAGVAGAPKFGNKGDWAPFIKTGIDTMVKNAIHGVGAMPPRGGSQATDEEMHAAVEYMVQAASK